jgi:hypothetical protein
MPSREKDVIRIKRNDPHYEIASWGRGKVGGRILLRPLKRDPHGLSVSIILLQMAELLRNR